MDFAVALEPLDKRSIRFPNPLRGLPQPPHAERLMDHRRPSTRHRPMHRHHPMPRCMVADAKQEHAAATMLLACRAALVVARVIRAKFITAAWTHTWVVQATAAKSSPVEPFMVETRMMVRLTGSRA